MTRFVLPGATEFAVPATTGPTCVAAALPACRAIGGVAFAVTGNTVPGLTETGLRPLAAGAAALSFEGLLAALLAAAGR